MRNVNAKIYKKDRDELVDVLRKYAGNREFFEDLLTDILTPAEINEITARLQIVKQLADGLPQRQICGNLHVSLATVARGSRVLEKGTGALAKVTGHRRNRK